jgi:hypothetical protein
MQRDRSTDREAAGARLLLQELSVDDGRRAADCEVALRDAGESLAELRAAWQALEEDAPDDLARRVAHARVVDELLRAETGDGLHERYNAPPDLESSPAPERPRLLLPNQLPHLFEHEQQDAARRKLVPVPAADRARLAQLAERGTLKWVLVDAGLVFGDERLFHPVLSRGKPVLAAGQVDLAVVDKSFYVIHLTNHSGHYKPPPATLALAEQAFRKAGFAVPPGSRKEHA